MPFYAEECASMLAVTFSGGDKMLRSIVSVLLNPSSSCSPVELTPELYHSLKNRAVGPSLRESLVSNALVLPGSHVMARSVCSPRSGQNSGCQVCPVTPHGTRGNLSLGLWVGAKRVEIGQHWGVGVSPGGPL